jgi:hypothetical protein
MGHSTGVWGAAEEGQPAPRSRACLAWRVCSYSKLGHVSKLDLLRLPGLQAEARRRSRINERWVRSWSYQLLRQPCAPCPLASLAVPLPCTFKPARAHPHHCFCKMPTRSCCRALPALPLPAPALFCRLEALRQLVPHTERANTASFLEEVITHVQLLQGRVAQLERQLSLPPTTGRQANRGAFVAFSGKWGLCRFLGRGWACIAAGGLPPTSPACLPVSLPMRRSSCSKLATCLPAYLPHLQTTPRAIRC